MCKNIVEKFTAFSLSSKQLLLSSRFSFSQSLIFFYFLFLIYRLLAMKNRHFAAEIRFFSALRISIEVNSILLSERNVRLRTSIILHFGVFLSLSRTLYPFLSHSLALSLSLFLFRERLRFYIRFLFVLFGTTRQRRPGASRKSSALLVYVCVFCTKERKHAEKPAGVLAISIYKRLHVTRQMPKVHECITRP